MARRKLSCVWRRRATHAGIRFAVCLRSLWSHYTEDTGTKNISAAKTTYTKLGTANLLKSGAVSGAVCAYSKSGKISIFNKGSQKL